MTDDPVETAALEGLRAQVVSQRRQLSDLINNVPGIVWEAWFDPRTSDERPDFVNSYFERVTGYTPDQWHGEPDFWRKIIHPDDRPMVESGLSRLIDSGGEGVLEFRWLGADGAAIDIEAHVTVIRDQDGSALGLRGVAMDVTRRKQLEATLQQQIDQLADLTSTLKRKNEELDQFAYVTSHDLKAPLRGIANLSAWIEEDFGDSIPDPVASHLRLLRTRVTRMQAMIDGILEYSRVGRTAARSESLSVRTLLTRIVDLIDMPPTFQIEIDSGMPTLWTERLRLEQVFLALLQNAVKHHDRGGGVIRVSAREQKDCVEFAVRDDGPGIAPEYFDKVFQMFQTLDSRDATENMGVGLTLAKKIVEYQGGEIAIEPSGERGTTVRFTWPKRPEEQSSV